MAKVKCTYDFLIKSSPGILFNFLSTASGLSQWFADHVLENENGFVFEWDGYQESCVILDEDDGHFIKLQMDSNEGEEYLEFRIEKSEVTDDTILIITEFVEQDEAKAQYKLWAAQVDLLVSCVGGRN